MLVLKLARLFKATVRDAASLHVLARPWRTLTSLSQPERPLSSREYPADTGDHRGLYESVQSSHLRHEFTRVRANPYWRPFQADDAGSIPVGRSSSNLKGRGLTAWCTVRSCRWSQGGVGGNDSSCGWRGASPTGSIDSSSSAPLVAGPRPAGSDSPELQGRVPTVAGWRWIRPRDAIVSNVLGPFVPGPIALLMASRGVDQPTRRDPDKSGSIGRDVHGAGCLPSGWVVMQLARGD
jgi:hypothetical protein